MKGKSINICNVFTFIVYVMRRHCDYSPRVQINLATPLARWVLRSESVIPFVVRLYAEPVRADSHYTSRLRFVAEHHR